MNPGKALLFFLFCVAIPAMASVQMPQDTTLKSEDGIELQASYFNPGKPGPAAVLLHQCNRERHAWDQLAVRLVAGGYHVLTFDYRGYGESGGEPFQRLTLAEMQVIGATKWPGDVDLAVNHLLSQPGVDRNLLIAGGASCGVNQAIRLARRNPAVKALVLLSGNADAANRDFLRQSPHIPVFMSAADDDGDAVSSMRWALGFSRNPHNKFVQYNAGGHGADMFPFQPQLIPSILDWLQSALSAKQPAKNATALPAGPVEQFWDLLNQPGNATKATQLYRELKKKDAQSFSFPEGEINNLGYQRLQAGDAQEAMEIFQLNLLEHPTSANVYDSIADAYLAAGQESKAKEYAQKAIDTLDQDKNTPEQFKAEIRRSAMQKLQPSTTAQGQGQPPLNEIIKMPIVLKVPDMESARISKDIVYKSVEGVDLKMDIYLPSKQGGKHPVVLLISGAGNDEPSPKDWAVFQTYGQLLASKGIAAIAFNKRYRRESQSFPDAEADIKDLIAYVRKNGESMGVNGDKICVAAYSAGGRLLAPFLREAVPGVRCLAGIYTIMASEANNPAEFSPLAQIGKSGQKLPIFIARAGLDSAQLNAGLDLFVREAVQQGFDVQSINHASGRHAFDILDDNERSREVIQTFVEFLMKNLAVDSKNQ